MSGFDDSDSDVFDDSLDDELLDQAVERTEVNRRVKETVIRRPRAVQRTLTGEVLEGEVPVYEEIHREVTFQRTHHELNRPNLGSYIYPSNFDVRDYQYDIIAKALYTNLLCAIPTGMGKTFIASTVMLNYYRWFTKGKIIFMAPTRPLVAQQIQACLGVTDIPSDDTAVLLDKSRKNRPQIWESKRVFFTTPQVVENDLKAGTLNPKEIVCLVIDEAHRARENYAYTGVVKFIDRFNTSFRVLALTATPASDIEGVQEVVNNLHISHIEIRTEESADIAKYMKDKEQVRINVDSNADMEDIIEMLGTAIEPILKQANEANIYDVTDPSRINAFVVMQKSKAVVTNPSLNEGVKWKFFFILQVIGYVGQMLRRLRIYGVRSFYSYFTDKCTEFRTKYKLGKSSNKLSASFFFHPMLKHIEKRCEELLEGNNYISHPKLEHLITELEDFCTHKKDSRVIVFTELRESALEIVQTIDNTLGDKCKAHIFIGQAKGKEKFDEEEYKMKNSKKGRGKKAREERIEKELAIAEQRQNQKKQDAERRATSRTGTSEEAQLQGMNQKMQKELIKKFKKGEFQVIVATSIGEEGLDIGEVDMIICYDTTSSPIKNIQRMGRTGRKNDGKVVLLFASNEESKFNQAMHDYALVQKRIEQNDLELNESDRIIPKDIKPRCEKTLIDIPESNLIIARGEDSDEVIKHATQAMLGKTPKSRKGTTLGKRCSKLKNTEPPTSARKKRFFMPDLPEVGFVKSSTLVRKVGGDNSKEVEEEDGESSDTDDGDFLIGMLKNKNSPISTAKTSANTSVGKVSANSKYSTPQRFTSVEIPLSKSTEPKESKEPGYTPINKPDTKQPSLVIDLNDSQDDPRVENKDIQLSMVLDHEEIVSSHVTLNTRKDVEIDHNEEVILASPEETNGSDSHKDIEDEIIVSSPLKSTTNRVGLNFSKAFEEDFADDDWGSDTSERNEKTSNGGSVIKDSEESDDENIFTDTIEQLKMHKDASTSIGNIQSDDEELLKSLSKNESSVSKLLNFGSYEEELSDFEPYEAAEKVMEQQYIEDPSFHDDGSTLSNSFKPSRRTASDDVHINKKAKKTTSKSLKAPSKGMLDISNLLKNIPAKKTLGARRLKVDISKVNASQIIDLDDPTQPGRDQKTATKFVYRHDSDRIVSNEFEPTEGFMNEEERTLFFSEVFEAEEVNLNVDPSISAKRNICVNVGHGNDSKRFASFISLCSTRCNKRLQRMVDEHLNSVAKLKQDPIVLTLDTQRTNDVGISLKSDDDDEFRDI